MAIKVKRKDLHRIVSTAIIYKKQKSEIKYLITQRNLNERVYPGLWTVPGGGLEVDDYINTPKTTSTAWYLGIEKSLRREIKEEVNLETGKMEYLLDIIFIRPDGTPVITLSFYCPYKSGKVKLNPESIGFVWVTCKEAKKYNLIEGIWEEIEMVDKILKGSRRVNFKKNK